MVLPAMPNFNAQFTLQPNYWVAFGNYFTGQILDIEHMTGAAEVTYPPGATSLTATLGPDNVIKVT